MTQKHEVLTQCTHADFLRTLPNACGNRPYEISGNTVTVFGDEEKQSVAVQITDQPIKKLGSLELPMEKAVFEFTNYSDTEADAFMKTFRDHTLRGGGG